MKPVKGLSCAAVDVEPRSFDFSQGYCETWEYFEAAECESCGKLVVGFNGENEHRMVARESDCHGYVCCEGPLMNFWYPLPESFCRDWDVDEAAKKLIGVNLCIVVKEDEDDYGLALTGGGMDLSWDICEAYMLLGFLPPAHFCRLPHFAGMKLNKKNAWIIAGCNRALSVSMHDKVWMRKDLKRLRVELKNEKERK